MKARMYFENLGRSAASRRQPLKSPRSWPSLPAKRSRVAGFCNDRSEAYMMAADMNDDPLERSTQDHLTREAVRESINIRAMLKAARGLDEERAIVEGCPVWAKESEE